MASIVYLVMTLLVRVRGCYEHPRYSSFLQSINQASKQSINRLIDDRPTDRLTDRPTDRPNQKVVSEAFL